MGGMKDILISIQEDLMEEVFPEKCMYELTEKEAEQLYEKAVEVWEDRIRDAADDMKDYLKYKGVPPESNPFIPRSARKRIAQLKEGKTEWQNI